MDPQQEISSSFNLVLDSNVSEQIRSIQKELVANFAELRNYDPSPHLSILTKFFDAPTAPTYAAALAKEFHNDTQWQLEFTHLSATHSSTGGAYIFLNVSEQSKEALTTLHERALKAAQSIGSEGKNGGPAKYAFDPHISIIKLPQEEAEAALKQINKSFHGVTMPVQKYVVTYQKPRDTNFSDFPIIAEINLI